MAGVAAARADRTRATAMSFSVIANLPLDVALTRDKRRAAAATKDDRDETVWKSSKCRMSRRGRRGGRVKTSAASATRSVLAPCTGPGAILTAMRDALGLTDDHRQVRDLARTLARERIAPHAAEIDETATYPEQQLRLLGDQGLMGLYI